MRSGNADRLWMILGVLVAGILTAVTYFVIISPTRADTESLRDRTETAQDRVITLRKLIAGLTEDKKNQPKLTAKRDALRDALPKNSGVPAFLRQLQASGNAVDVDVSGLTVGAPEEEKEVPGVWSLGIQLTADGTAEHLDAFLRQLQGSAQKRAVLIEGANLGAGESASEGGMRLSLSIKAFVAPGAGAGAPTVTTD